MKEVIHKYHFFDIISVDNNNVILIKKEIEELKRKETETLSNGFRFAGRMHKANMYGVNITYRFTTGFIHVSKITTTYTKEETNTVKRMIRKKLKEVFDKGRFVDVVVNSIYPDGSIDLNFDKQGENTLEILKELKILGL